MTAIAPGPVGTTRLRLVPLEPGHVGEMAAVLSGPVLSGPVLSAATAAAVGLSPSGGWHDGEQRRQRSLTPEPEEGPQA